MKRVSSSKPSTLSYLHFGKQNFLLMAIGCAVIALGYIMMMGGRDTKDTFNPDEIYSFVRITLSPIMILGGFALLAYGILRKNTSSSSHKFP